MSVLGKIAGLCAGYAAGARYDWGFVAAMLGLALGAAVDHMLDNYHIVLRKPKAPPPSQEVLRRARRDGVVILAAKLAKADGAVSRAEIAAFKRLFQIPAEEVGEVGRLFNEARKTALGFEPHALALATQLRRRPEALRELLDALVEIAEADGPMGPAETDYLRKVAAIFGFRDFAPKRALPTDSDPYRILGVPPEASAEEIKAVWRNLIREHHPDTLMAKGMSKELVETATRKMAAINAAYDRIRKERGLA